MKTLRILIGLALVASVGVNVFLWRQLEAERAEVNALQANAAEAEALRAENEALKAKGSTAKSGTSDADARELARLRNDVSQLRKQTGDVESLRAQAAEASKLRAQLAAAQKAVATAEERTDEVAKLTAEEALALKQEAKAVQCINSMKQIGLAARIWAKEHNGVFPPDLASLKDQIPSVKILFCPAAPGGVQATTWEELNPTTISYQFLNPNGSASEPQKPLTLCPIHGNSGLSDGSVSMNRKQ